MTEGRTRRLAAVWFADIVGYTALSTRDEDAALAVVDEFQRLSREAVGDKGRVVKFLGDGALSVFDSTNRALESAIQLRDAFAAAEVAQRHGCTLSVGVHVGEVVQAEDGDVYGDGVNVASRIEGVASSNQVVVSEAVYHLIRNRSGYNPQSIGEHRLKGVDKPAPLYVLARPGETVEAPLAAAAGSAVTPGTAAAARTEKSHRKAVAIGTAAGVTGFVLLSTFVAWSVRVVEEPGADAASEAPAAQVANDDAAAADMPPPAPPTAQGNGQQAAQDGARPTTTASGDRVAPSTDAPSSDAGTTATTDAAATRPQPAPSDAPTSPPADQPAGNRLLVLVFGEGAPAQTAETQVLQSLQAVRGVEAMDATGATILRRNPDIARGVAEGDIAALSQQARRQGVEYIVIGMLDSSASPARGGRMFSGTAQLGLRMYRVSTGEVVNSGNFGVGAGNRAAVVGATELGARVQAAQQAGREGATAARRWLTSALRN